MSRKFLQTSYDWKAVQKISATSTAAVRSTQFNEHIATYRISGIIDAWIATGTSTVTASSTGDGISKFYPAGVTEYYNTQDRFVSVLPNGSSGFVCISEEVQ